jgi:hypothetical protein
LKGENMDPLFEVHKLNEQGLRLAAAIAAIFNGALADLSTYCPAGREWSIAKTKMEESCFFCKKAMANDPKNQA